MPETDDLKTQALSSTHDFYTLLNISQSAQDTEIRRAYRKTALKYHPDKVGPTNTAALEKFHLLQIAYDVLSDPTIRELYDNARKAREAKRERDDAFEGRRRKMKEELERREGVAVGKRKREDEAEVEFERELRRLAEDGARRRREREELLKREMEDGGEDSEVDGSKGEATNAHANGEVSDMDRSITLRFPQHDSTKHIDKEQIVSRFNRFGPIEEVVLRDKKMKIEGSKHRQRYNTAILVYKSIVGAHAAITDFPALSKADPDRYNVFEAVGWAAGQAPDFIPQSRPASDAQSNVPRRFDPDTASTMQNGHAEGVKKAPTFGSFKGASKSATPSSPSLDDITMIRLKNAERRRMEERIRKEEAAAAATDHQSKEATSGE